MEERGREGDRKGEGKHASKKEERQLRNENFKLL